MHPFHSPYSAASTMESADAIVAISDSERSVLPEPQSQLSALVYDVTQQAEVAMGDMLKMISEIDQSSAGIMDEIEKCKDNAVMRKKLLEEEKERFQKAAFSVLEMLNASEIC